jgi:hypothetical protein
MSDSSDSSRKSRHAPTRHAAFASKPFKHSGRRSEIVTVNGRQTRSLEAPSDPLYTHSASLRSPKDALRS